MKLLLAALVTAAASFQASGQATGILEGSTGDPFKSLPIRLCSIDRVLQTKSDEAGAFKMVDVPAGEYELVVGDLFPVVRRVSIKADEVASVALGGADLLGARDSSCYRDARLPPCDLTRFRIKYGDIESRSLGLVSGEVQDVNGRKHKVLGDADITLLGSGNAIPAYSTTTDKKGRFQLNVPQGLYDVIVSHKGFQEGKISKVLVPRDNATEILITMMRTGSVIVCGDQ